jgi:molecular chaperone HtpG
MGEYTLHDETHLFRVLELMDLLIGEDNLQLMTAPELMLLIISCFFHDLGMAPLESEIQTFRKIWDLNPNIEEAEKNNFDKFNRFAHSYPEQMQSIKDVLAKGESSQADTLKGYLTAEFVRQTHADRIKQIIKGTFENKISYKNKDITVELAEICYSHNQGGLAVLEFERDLRFGDGVVACIPLIGTILRLADILDFDAKRTPSSLFSHLNIKHPVSLVEWQKHRSIDAWDINNGSILFSATCTHPAIQSAINKFCDLIDNELQIAKNVLAELQSTFERQQRSFKINIPLTVDRQHIKTKRNIDGKPIFDYSDTSFTLSKQQVVNLLMGTELYGNPEVAIRELLQNSIDTCLLRKIMEKGWGTSYEPEVTIQFVRNGTEVSIEVQDNGCGMDKRIIDNYYSKIGSSYYKSTEFYGLRHSLNSGFIPRSRFGIGILSCFMISDTIEVETRRLTGNYTSEEPLKILIQGQDSIFWIQEGQRQSPGTSTKLILRQQNNPLFNKSDMNVIGLIQRIIPNPPFNIKVKTASEEVTFSKESFKALSEIDISTYQWDNREFVRFFDVDLTNSGIGIYGFAKVAILEQFGEPVNEVELNERIVQVEEIDYTLKRNLRMNENSINEDFQTISITDNDSINQHNGSSQYNKSISRFSLHGIEIPSNLFPNYWELIPNQVRLLLPFSAILIIDVSDPIDLKLNSARTEVLTGEKWNEFEVLLCYQLCKGLKSQVTVEYWNKLKEIFLNNSNNNNFKEGLNKLESENILM